MIRFGKIFLGGIVAMPTLVLLAMPASAQPSSDFKIMIFPLECSVDLLNVGVGTFRQLTPENCMDPEVEPGIPGVTRDAGDTTPPTEMMQPPFYLRGPGYGSLTVPLEQTSLTPFPDSPDVKRRIITDKLHEQTMNSLTTGQVQVMAAIIAAVPLLALLCSVVYSFVGRIARK